MVYHTLKIEPHYRNYQINIKFLEKDSGYYCWKLRNKKVKQFSEITRVKQAEPLVQLEQA